MKRVPDRSENVIDNLPTINPLIRESVLTQSRSEDCLTLQGVLGRSLQLSGISLASAGLFWTLVSRNIVNNQIQYGLGWWFFATPFLMYAFVKGMHAKPELSKYIAPVAAAFIGIFYGSLSGMAQAGGLGGTVLQAASVALFSFFGMFLAYRLKWIRVEVGFVRAIYFSISALLSIFVANGLLSILFLDYRDQIFTFSQLSLGLHAGIFVLSCAVFALDLSVIEDNMNAKAPKHLEWYFGFSLVFNLVWMYVTLLLLFARLGKGR